MLTDHLSFLSFPQKLVQMTYIYKYTHTHTFFLFLSILLFEHILYMASNTFLYKCFIHLSIFPSRLFVHVVFFNFHSLPFALQKNPLFFTLPLPLTLPPFFSPTCPFPLQPSTIRGDAPPPVALEAYQKAHLGAPLVRKDHQGSSRFRQNHAPPLEKLPMLTGASREGRAHVKCGMGNLKLLMNNIIYNLHASKV